MGKIIWLASYPKSGNTWFRAFLANFLCEHDEPVDINHLGCHERSGPLASARTVFDEATGVESSELTLNEIERYRPRIYEQISRQIEKKSEEPLFMKIHDAFTRNAWGEPIISKAATQGVIYFLRNPLDIAVSYAHHSAVSVAQVMTVLNETDHDMKGSPKRLNDQLPQRLLTWSEHVCSWVDEPGLSVHVMHYEQMKRNPFETFRNAVHFAGLPDDPARIQKALDLVSFEKLKAQEEAKGFRERLPMVQSFFRKGQIGSWRKVLTDEQVKAIVQAHSHVMRRFGYLTEAGELVD